jgi:hypothetical protein
MSLQPTSQTGAILSGYGNIAVNGATPALVVAANPNRQELRFINYSTSPDAFLGMDTTVTITNGWPLFAGSEQDASRGFGSMYLGPVYAVNNGTGTSDIRVWESCR